MSEKTDEWLSSLVDGELSAQAGARVLPELRRDDALLERWSRYHLIRDTLRNALPDWVCCDLAQRVNAALAEEPTVLAPHRRRDWRSWSRQAAGIGIAATIAAVAIMAVPDSGRTPGGEPVVATTAPAAPIPMASPATVVSAQDAWERPPLTVDYRLSGYLVNHNEYSVVSGMQGALPYMRIVGAPVTRHVSDETR